MRELRKDIEAATGCTASAGVGPSLLLARLATRRAKPNGQLLVTAREVRSWGHSCLGAWVHSYIFLLNRTAA